MNYLMQGDAAAVPLPDESVHCVVTSPPYWSLRKYAGEQSRDWPAVEYAPMPGLDPVTVPAMRCALGLEPTPEAYTAHMVLVFRDIWRVLRGDGVTWVVIGDSYASQGGPEPAQTKWQVAGASDGQNDGKSRKPGAGLQQGDLVGIPARLMLALQASGWICRNDCVWSKCLSGGAMVYAKTQKGEMPMMVKDMVRLDPATVQLWDGEKWNQAAGWSETPRPEHPLEIELRNGQRIGCTPDHKWPIDGLGLLVEAKDLQPGMVIKSTWLPEPAQPRMPSALDDDDIGWFIGIYLAEGSLSEGSIQIASHIKETSRAGRLEKLAQDYDGYCFTYQTSENGMTIIINSPILRGVLDTYLSGNTAHRKHLNIRCWKRSNAFLSALLYGYLEGDGYWDGKRWKLGFCKNDALAADLRTLASRIGVSLRLRRCMHVMGERKFPGWHGSLCEPSLRRTNDFEIMAIRQSRARKFWEITLKDKPHTFALTCGVLTHNSNPMPESVSGWNWQPHRVKVESTRQTTQGYASAGNHRDNPGGGLDQGTSTVWQPCPGCPTCEPNGGLVLRRGSWRHTRAHETVLMLTKGMGYFANQEAVRELNSDKWQPSKMTWEKRKALGHYDDGNRRHDQTLDGGQYSMRSPGGLGHNPAGRNPRSVFHLSSEPFKGAHYAVFPKSLIAPLIRATCPARCCPVCGAGWAAVVERTSYTTPVDGRHGRVGHNGQPPQQSGWFWQDPEISVLGYRATCTCPADDWQPGTVLDPFCGSGTTLAVARELGLRGIGLDLSHSYLDEQAKVRARVSAPSGALDALPLFGAAGARGRGRG